MSVRRADSNQHLLDTAMAITIHSSFVPHDAEVVQGPTEQSCGVRDCTVRDPAGTMVRIQEVR